jgi:hypothetical protein
VALEPQLRRLLRLQTVLRLFQAGTEPVPLVEALMSTVLTPVLDKDTPTCRLAIAVPTIDFWDATNKRYKSGFVHVAVASVAFAGTLTSGEKLALSIAPPNYRPNANGRVDDLNRSVTAGTWSGGYDLTTAVNYGLVGPSAAQQPDGSNDLVYVDVALLGGDDGAIASSATATVTYTTTFIEIDPYADLDGDRIDAELFVNRTDGQPAWGMAAVSVGSGLLGAVALQLTALESTVLAPPFATPAIFQAGIVPQEGPPAMRYAWPLPATASRVLPLADRYTWVFAANDGKVDANATPVLAGGPGLMANLCNFGVEGGADAGKVYAKLSYQTKAVGV